MPDICREHSHVLPARNYPRFARAVDSALREVLGPNHAATVYVLVSREVGHDQIPLAQSILMWVSDNLPKQSAQISPRHGRTTSVPPPEAWPNVGADGGRRPVMLPRDGAGAGRAAEPALASRFSRAPDLDAEPGAGPEPAGVGERGQTAGEPQRHPELDAVLKRERQHDEEDERGRDHPEDRP